MACADDLLRPTRSWSTSTETELEPEEKKARTMQPTVPNAPPKVSQLLVHAAEAKVAPYLAEVTREI